ncbi:MAG: amidohydrolase family protein [Caldilineaceae bacterium]
MLRSWPCDSSSICCKEPTHEQAVEAVKTAMAKVHSMGIVGVHNMEGAPALRAFQHLRAEGQLKLRLLQQIPEADMEAAIQMGICSGLGDDWIRLGAVKIFADGSLGARSALMVEHYEDEPQNFGIAVATAEHLNAAASRSRRPRRAGRPYSRHWRPGQPQRAGCH